MDDWNKTNLVELDQRRFHCQGGLHYNKENMRFHLLTQIQVESPHLKHPSTAEKAPLSDFTVFPCCSGHKR